MRRTAFIGLLLIFMNASHALSNPAENLFIKTDNSYLLSFDEQIVNYKLSNEKAVKVEFLSSIFNNKQGLIIKPLKDTSTLLTIQTGNNTYNFNLYANNSGNLSGNIPAKFTKGATELEIDRPPMAFYNDISDLELDRPPGIK